MVLGLNHAVGLFALELKEKLGLDTLAYLEEGCICWLLHELGKVVELTFFLAEAVGFEMLFEFKILDELVAVLDAGHPGTRVLVFKFGCDSKVEELINHARTTL